MKKFSRATKAKKKRGSFEKYKKADLWEELQACKKQSSVIGKITVRLRKDGKKLKARLEKAEKEARDTKKKNDELKNSISTLKKNNALDLEKLRFNHSLSESKLKEENFKNKTRLEFLETAKKDMAVELQQSKSLMNEYKKNEVRFSDRNQSVQIAAKKHQIRLVYFLCIICHVMTTNHHIFLSDQRNAKNRGKTPILHLFHP